MMIDLIEIHERTHRNLKELMAHCATLTAEELDRETDGFGYPSVRLQLHHSLAAEKYWVDVLRGATEFEHDDAAYPDLPSLEALREETFDATRAYLRDTPAERLAEGGLFVTWGGDKRVLIPGHVVLRTITHHYHHMGLVMSLCRLLGRPGEGVNYPIT